MAELKRLQQLMEQNQARLKALRESFRSQLSALVKEVASALQTLTLIEREFTLSNERIQEQRAAIDHHQEQLTQLRETGMAMETKIAGVYTELSEQQQQIAILKATLMETEGRMEAVEQEHETRKTQLESKQNRLAEKQRELGHLTAGKEKEVARYKEELKNAEEKMKKIQKANPVAAFLLTEGLEPPELDILAMLIHRREVPITEIKRIVKTPPAITTRVLKEMENKGLLEITSTDNARLSVSL